MTGANWFRLAAVLGFLAVALGAFGAHGLRGHLKTELEYDGGSRNFVSATRRLEVFETGVKYHMFHALAVLAVAWLMSQAGANATLCGIAGWSFVAGIVLFSGSLYLLGFTGRGWLGAITPLGGVAFLIGWSSLFLAAGGLDRAREAGLTP